MSDTKPIPKVCIECGKPLSRRDADRGACHDCRSPQGKVADLDIAIRAPGDTPQRIAGWPAIRDLLRSIFERNVPLPETALWERCTDRLRSDGFEPNDYLRWPLTKLAEHLQRERGRAADQDAQAVGAETAETSGSTLSTIEDPYVIWGNETINLNTRRYRSAPLDNPSQYIDHSSEDVILPWKPVQADSAAARSALLHAQRDIKLMRAEKHVVPGLKIVSPLIEPQWLAPLRAHTAGRPLVIGLPDWCHTAEEVSEYKSSNVVIPPIFDSSDEPHGVAKQFCRRRRSPDGKLLLLSEDCDDTRVGMAFVLCGAKSEQLLEALATAAAGLCLSPNPVWEFASTYARPPQEDGYGPCLWLETVFSFAIRRILPPPYRASYFTDGPEDGARFSFPSDTLEEWHNRFVTGVEISRRVNCELGDLVGASIAAIDLLLAEVGSDGAPAIPGLARDGQSKGATADEQPAKGHQAQADVQTEETADLAGNEESKPEISRPPDKAFRAWYIRDMLGVSNQTEIAEMMTKLGIMATQGQVSKWLREVEKYRAAGGIIPTVDKLNKPEAIDPSVIDMGARRDGLTPRQRPRRDSDADSGDE